MTTDDITMRDLGQLLMCGFHGLEPSNDIIDLIQNHNLGSVILFSRNIDSPEQVHKLTQSLQKLAYEAGHSHPLLIAVDQENGILRRLGSSGTYLPGNMALGALDSWSAARDVASATSKELISLGINWNLAPVLDTNNNPLNPVIGVRSFGEDPELVARLGLAQIEGYQNNGVATCIKHFPGHGDTATDSHLDVPVIEKTLTDIEKTELVPFCRSFLAKGKTYPASVMVAHMSLPHIIREKGRVSSLASEVVHDMLRKQLRYEGIIITDCLEMDAVQETVGAPKGAVLALQAGNDMVMISHTYELQKDTFKKLDEALQGKFLDGDSLKGSLHRVRQLKEKLLSWDDVLAGYDLAQMGSVEHQKLSKYLYSRIPTVVRNDDKVIPLKSSDLHEILFLAAHVPVTRAIDSEKDPFNSFQQALLRYHQNTKYVVYDEHTPDQSEVIKKADCVVVGTANANLHPFQVDMVQTVQKHAKRFIVVAVMNPYDLMMFPMVGAYMVTYEYTPPAHEAAVSVLFGEITTHSSLPITIPNTMKRPLFKWKAEDYRTQDLEGVFRLWQENFGKDWPLTMDNFNLVLKNTTKPRHFVVRDIHGKILGFAATQILPRAVGAGQLVLLMVSPEHQGHGIGSRLHDACLEHWSMEGVHSLKIGSNYPRFFPGVPEHCIKAQRFFRGRGWCIDKDTVWDLAADLRTYETPKSISTRVAKENIWFGRILPSQIWELYAFQQRQFPRWLPRYRELAELGDFQDLIVAREGNDQGQIVASLLLCTTNISSEKRSDLIWTDKSLYGDKCGSMAYVGVAEKERGRGIGLGIAAYANEILKKRGVEKAYMDFVKIPDFYRRIGYDIWRGYHLAGY
ncbi:hypothetical protein DFQ28_002250 [Apophysomyces sp. BC1034]|nr:hypothetical protein DFQ30_002818 [Apophysomyces sp. BC1015]KAG0179761.1 hypothetical protein DFQ29_001704 [Apophysomyces sp. BC1021]KAG0190300.1 hypothetical protein DFQ28_002250 [Apophysomyces sp. BC1034]